MNARVPHNGVEHTRTPALTKWLTRESDWHWFKLSLPECAVGVWIYIDRAGFDREK